MTEADRNISLAYPPTYHLLRDMGIYIDRDAHGSRAALEVVPELCGDAGGLRTGVLATLVDVVGGETATRAVQPGWVATCDLVLHRFAPIETGVVVARPSVLRVGRSTVVLEIALGREGDEAALGLSTLTFSVLEARGDMQKMSERADDARTDFRVEGEGLAEPLIERIGCRVVDPGAGEVEMALSGYVGNSLGAVQGGALAILVELAAEAAGRFVGRADWVTTDLTVHYLALGRSGPIRTAARVLRREASSALLRVEVRDAGADDRLVVVGTATVEALG